MDKKYFLKKPKGILVQDVLYYKGMAESLQNQVNAFHKESAALKEKLNVRTCQRNAAVVAAKQLLELAELI